ncbi:MAG: hypothetical protein ACXVEF_23700 [Polyangiales bacterium]
MRFEGWTPQDWSRFLSIFRAAPQTEPLAEDEPRGGLVIVHDGGRIRKALHTLDGRVDPHTISWPEDLATIAEERRVRFIWTFHSGALDELMERFGARVHRGDDVLNQALIFAAVFRELIAEGAIRSWPRKLEGVPIPTRPVVDRAIDAVVPAGKALVLALYEDRELWTSIVLRRSTETPARFDLIAGPLQLRRETGLVSGEFRRDARHLVAAIEALYAPVAVALHAEVATFRRLITSAQPGDWARAVGLRDVVLSPLPPVLALPLGLDATRGAYDLASRAAKQIDPIGIVQPLLRLVNRALPELPPTGGASPGFNPLELLRRALSR